MIYPTEAVTAPSFPRVHARALDGTTHMVPATLPGTLRIILLGFAEAQQPAIDRWMTALRPCLADRPRVTVWEMPVAPPLGPVQRFLIDEGMRQAIRDEHARAHTVTLYTPIGALRKALGIARPGVHLVALDAAGAVLLVSDEPPTPAAVARVLALVEAT